MVDPQVSRLVLARGFVWFISSIHVWFLKVGCRRRNFIETSIVLDAGVLYYQQKTAGALPKQQAR
jgi:hypothetical protein